MSNLYGFKIAEAAYADEMEKIALDSTDLATAAKVGNRLVTGYAGASLGGALGIIPATTIAKGKYSAPLLLASMIAGSIAGGYGGDKLFNKVIEGEIKRGR